MELGLLQRTRDGWVLLCLVRLFNSWFLQIWESCVHFAFQIPCNPEGLEVPKGARYTYFYCPSNCQGLPNNFLKLLGQIQWYENLKCSGVSRNLKKTNSEVRHCLHWDKATAWLWALCVLCVLAACSLMQPCAGTSTCLVVQGHRRCLSTTKWMRMEAMAVMWDGDRKQTRCHEFSSVEHHNQWGVISCSRLLHGICPV